MGYNIEDVAPNVLGGPDQFTFTFDLSLSPATMVTGDFNLVSLFGGAPEAGSYSFSALSSPSLGTLTSSSTNGTWSFVEDWVAVLATGTDQTVSFTVIGATGASSDVDTITMTLLICMARGTRIAVEHGAVPVEALLVGDLVCTRDGVLKSIRWVGSRKVSVMDEAAWPTLRPWDVQLLSAEGARAA